MAEPTSLLGRMEQHRMAEQMRERLACDAHAELLAMSEGGQHRVAGPLLLRRCASRVPSSPAAPGPGAARPQLAPGRLRCSA